MCCIYSIPNEQIEQNLKIDHLPYKNPYLTSAYSRTNFVLENQFPYHTLHVGSLKSSFDKKICFNVDDDKLPFHHFD
jgi:hypothetical protein